ncbi:unnamed protein product, partial [marine sediment metagenome]
CEVTDVKSLILADVHANLSALEAVLDRESTWDEVIFLGDVVVAGPQPDEVLSLLASLDGIFLMGNHDREVLEVDPDAQETDADRLWVQWTRRQISERNLRFLHSFSDTCVLQRDGLAMRLLHGVLPQEWGYRLWPDTAPQFFASLADRYSEPVILSGHSHVQFQKVQGGITFINPGSVGQPRLEQPLACYAVLRDGQINLEAVPYDVERTCRAMDRVSLNDEEFLNTWKESYRRAVTPARYGVRDLSHLRGKGYR